MTNTGFLPSRCWWFYWAGEAAGKSLLWGGYSVVRVGNGTEMDGGDRRVPLGSWSLGMSQFSSAQSLSHIWFFATPWTAAHCPSPTPGACSNLCPSSQGCHPTILSCHPLLLLPSVFPSTRVFSSESALCIRQPNYRSFSFSISPSNEYSGLVSFRIDWLDLLAVQGTHKSLPQHYSSKVSILQHSVLFMAQLLYPYVSTGKTMALIGWTFVSNVSAF